VVDKLRDEHQEALKREQAQVDLERERVRSLTETFAVEKASMENTIEELRKKNSYLLSRTSALELATSSATAVEMTTVAMDTDNLDASSDKPQAISNSKPEGTVTEPTKMELTLPTSATASTSEATIATMAQLIRAQTEALAAQIQAAAVQHLPPLKTFTGEGKLTDTDSFERWLESFEERAALVGWNEAQQLHQLKILLDKTALRTFRTFSEDVRHNLEQAKEALKSRFRSVEIEELCGLEFHHKMQTSETIEELGLELQTLANKAFPSTPAKDFDRILKGRFFQALHVRWQRKLGAPKTNESFKELYDRARILEQHEKQYMLPLLLPGDILIMVGDTSSLLMHFQGERIP